MKLSKSKKTHEWNYLKLYTISGILPVRFESPMEIRYWGLKLNEDNINISMFR